MRAPDRGRLFFFAPRAPWAHSLTLLFVEMFYRLCPREKDSTPNKKKKHVQCACFFAPRAARAHSLTLLFVEMFYRLGPREKDSTPNKKKTRPVRVFFLLPAGPGLTHSRFFLWKCFVGSAPERRTAHRTKKKKKNTSSARVFLLPARPGLTHSRFFLWKCFIGSAPERRTAHPTKKKTRPVRVFFFAPRAARAHSLTLLFVEMFYRLGPREKDSTPNKK